MCGSSVLPHSLMSPGLYWAPSEKMATLATIQAEVVLLPALAFLCGQAGASHLHGFKSLGWWISLSGWASWSGGDPEVGCGRASGVPWRLSRLRAWIR